MRATAVLTSLFLLAACNADPRQFSANGPGGRALPSPNIQGTITKVTPQQPPGETQGTVLVEENPSQPSGSAKIVFTVKNTTELLRRQGGADQRIGFNELRLGQTVQAWSTGPVAESYPAQAQAATILVISGP
jgi:hypothetical protein